SDVCSSDLLADVDLYGRIGVHAAGVVHSERGITFAAETGGSVVLFDFAKRHAYVGAAAGDINFAGLGKRCDGSLIDRGGLGLESGFDIQLLLHYVKIHGADREWNPVEETAVARSGRGSATGCAPSIGIIRSEEHTSELQSRE